MFLMEAKSFLTASTTEDKRLSAQTGTSVVASTSPVTRTVKEDGVISKN